MKTKLNLRVSLALLSMLFISNSFAQKDFSDVSAYRFSFTKSWSAFPLLKNHVISNEVVSAKILKHFNKAFKNAENIKWQQLDDNFLATFVTEKLTTKSLFDKKGDLIYTINYSGEDQLPFHLKTIVKNKYKDCDITSVARILQDNRQIWIVKLAGKTNYIATRIENGEMEETENFRKAN